MMNDDPATPSPEVQRIRERAHELWEKAGKPPGRHEEFWHQAEAEVRGEDQRTVPKR